MNRLIEDRLGERARVFAGERAILVGLDVGHGADWQERESMEELIELARTAGLEILRTVLQKRDRPDPAFFIGKGKAEELHELATKSGAEVVVFNDALTPAQARNLEERIQRKIIDRAQLIMNIFAQRARSKEAKLQVELAQLEYLLPRLRGWAEALGQPGAGIGTRGPGETRLAQERHAIRQRMHTLKEQLAQAHQERAVRRKLRAKRKIPEIALIGYTNTGKSTLLRALTGAETFIEDKLFATLDPLTRQMYLPDGQLVVITDTVGFIKKLPHPLIPAFASTLETAQTADLVLNVLDVSNPNLFDHWRTITEVLNSIFKNGARPPMLNVLNKVDKLHTLEDHQRLEEALSTLANSVVISAKERVGIEELKGRIGRMLTRAA
uniref:GTPase HflX n=2 Tax=Candidatus Bipolaricaulota TaxID=67810 RepID=H5SDK0_9BACT|nr:GTP-binding protein HflX [uncultured Acetothermia bacterium]BAL60266.1 GTP-binding protein HflX [Candidatus Acetothermum autotrophicum]